ncbi:MAG: hypothetical protein H6672_02000 [Anaerolineaceae bacterium]|nr:hypothetical protein [Anaerolineaceae bacterium]
MRIIVAIIMCLCFSLPVIAQAPGDPLAAEEGEVITGIVAFEGAVIYVGPDFAYRIVGELPLNGSVTVIGRRGDFIRSWNGQQWLEIAFDDGSAWVYARLIRTSVPFNSIPPTGRPLPRNRDGRVPDTFDLSENICDTWGGTFTQSGSVLSRDTDIVVTYPEMPGANVYSVVVIAPSGSRTAFDSETTTATILDSKLRSVREYGEYTWRVAPYWTYSSSRYGWQQLCLLQTGGTFNRPRP